MSSTLRIATFNVENLFSRAKLLNFMDREYADGLLAKVDRLRQELRKRVYNKPEILRIYKSLRSYITIVEVREKLFDRSKSKVVANGVKEWSGFIQFKRDTFSEVARLNAAKVIKAVNADILCLIEVESRPVLKHFCGARLPAGGNFKAYPHLMLVDGNDNREIDVAMMSRLPIQDMRSHIDDRQAGKLIFSRDCLELQLLHRSGRELFILLNHFKSKGYGSRPSSNAKRTVQALRVRQILKKYDLRKQLVVVAGDLNDTPGSASLKPLLSVPHLHDVLKEGLPDPDERWTYHYKSNIQIDYLLVSKPLRAALKEANVFRRGMYGVHTFSAGAIKPFSTVKGPTSSASDHGAVWADFEL